MSDPVGVGGWLRFEGVGVARSELVQDACQLPNVVASAVEFEPSVLRRVEHPCGMCHAVIVPDPRRGRRPYLGGRSRLYLP